MSIKDEIQEQIDIISNAEQKVFDKLSELPNEGRECNCDDCTIYKYIHEGNHFDEIMVTCINCGGFVDNNGLL